ncbi:MAG: response regulator transcription factor [Saprospiraceae bacterium]|nr:response regulator transcription factor [Saprospiraceae bacterium]
MINQNPTIFIVDDEPLLSEMLTDYLKDQYENFNIVSFPTGEACLQSLDKQPDAVVLDFHLNSKEKDAANGIDILRELKSKTMTYQSSCYPAKKAMELPQKPLCLVQYIM